MNECCRIDRVVAAVAGQGGRGRCWLMVDVAGDAACEEQCRCRVRFSLGGGGDRRGVLLPAAAGDAAAEFAPAPRTKS